MDHRDTMSCLFVCTIASPLPKQSLITRAPPRPQPAEGASGQEGVDQAVEHGVQSVAPAQELSLTHRSISP